MTLLTEKSIAEIIKEKYNFFIPSYQRGYRWTDQQAKELLEDIWEFSQKEKSSNEWYCLQPIVVLKNKDNQDEVIDGQQRLTTIYLILKYLGIESPYSLKYETRQESTVFLQTLKTEKEPNIDFHHILEVNNATIEWFKNEKIDKEKIKEAFLNKTKVIWYEVDSKFENVREESIKIFTRINMGKIPLTNAELIKALFLNSSNFKDSNSEQIKLKQLEIAGEWDRIEYALQNKEFWWFLNKDENKIATRIEFIFDLIIKSEESSSDPYFTFNKFKTEFSIEKWSEIKQTFQTLESWFIDSEMYHKIGFLISLGDDIKKIFEYSIDKSKSEFNKHVNELIKNKLPKEEIDKLEYGPDSFQIRCLLLWHNIHTLIQNKNGRFPFDKYKENKWDIEHIHAIADETKLTKDNYKKWIEDNWSGDARILELKIKLELSNQKLGDNELSEFNTLQKEKARIEELRIKENLSDEELDEIKNLVLGKEDDSIRNLCLLDSTTNRSYKNASFKYKRIEIIERDKKSVFIPISTKNVFLKLFNPSVTQMELWNGDDKKAYLTDIKNSLTFTTNETE
jgi:uncharacterized protein with ParB-like and HNH nuclease domain